MILFGVTMLRDLDSLKNHVREKTRLQKKEGEV